MKENMGNVIRSRKPEIVVASNFVFGVGAVRRRPVDADHLEIKHEYLAPQIVSRKQNRG